MSDPRILTVRPEPGEYAWTFGGAAPVARIAPGTVLDLYTEDCFAGRVRSEKDLVSEVCEFPYLNPQTGPFYVEGAEPGDTVAVHFVSIEPARDWAASTTVPLFGALTSTAATATLQPPLEERVWIWQLDRTRRTALFRARDSDFEAELPLDPMHGTVGVAPANLEVRSALVPDAHGGNMDTPEMRAGVTCYLGVGHARRGGARGAVAYLLERGRSWCVATITGPLDMYVAECRLRGYREALERAGVEVRSSLVVEGDFTQESGRRAVTGLIERHPELDAVFAASGTAWPPGR
ncbi:HTH-type transcriptional repressor PurR [Streptomyces fumanus]